MRKKSKTLRRGLAYDILQATHKAPFDHLPGNGDEEIMEFIPSQCGNTNSMVVFVTLQGCDCSHSLDSREVLGLLLGTLGCLCYLPDQCTTWAYCFRRLVNVQHCAVGLHCSVVGIFIISLIAVSTPTQ